MSYEKNFIPAESKPFQESMFSSKEEIKDFIVKNIPWYSDTQFSEPIGNEQSTLGQFLEKANDGSEWTDPHGFKISIVENKFRILVNNGNKEIGVDKNILNQKEIGLRELFKNSKNPVEVILQEMDSDKIKEFVNVSLLNEAKNKLNGLSFKNEDEFVSKILEIGEPIWEITQKGKQDLFKQPNREMFTAEDVQETVKNIQATKAQRIYIVGNVGSGKSTFARELAGQTNFKNIDLDHFFQIYRQEKNKEANLSELLSFVLEREEPPYIINHADLLSHNLSDKADMVILLNPKKEEQIKSRQIRQENKTDGEWQKVNVDDYDKISQNNLESLANAKGKVVYNNDKSGTLVKSLEK